MTGHHSWEELMRERYTPEERARIRAEASKMLEEDDRRSRRPDGGTAAEPNDRTGADPHAAEARVAGPRSRGA